MQQQVTVTQPMAQQVQPLVSGGFPFSGIAGLAGNLISQWMASKTAKRNTDMTIQANKQMAEYQYSKDLEMWNLQNAYNSPEMQMARLNKAGLNPNLVYGSGSVAGNTSGSMPKYNAPTLQYNYKPAVDPGSAIAQYQDLEMRQAQIDNARTQNRVIEMEGAIKAIEAAYRNRLLFFRVKDSMANVKGKEISNDWKLGAGDNYNLMKLNDGEYYRQQLSNLARSQAQVSKIKADEELVRLNLRLKPWETGAGIIGKIGGAVGSIAKKYVPALKAIPAKKLNTQSYLPYPKY